MKTIYKYPLKITDIQIIKTFQHAYPLSVQFQRGTLCLWMMVDPTEAADIREVRVIGTGHPLDIAVGQYEVIGNVEDMFDYISTVQEADGQLIWHIFIK